MKRLFTLLLLSFAALSCEMGDEKLDDFIGRDDSSVATIPNNQIWYTSTDGKIVEPYSGIENNYAVFGANIVSNTYNAEKECWIITFDGKVTTIGDYAFDGCSSLTSITIPNSVTTIGWSAFYQCSNLTSVTIPDSVTIIGSFAFANCGSLTSVTIPDSVTTIGMEAFVGCSSLTSVIIGDSVTTIGEGAFYGCSSLTSITIPDSVTKIGEKAFYCCSSLQEFNGKFASDDGRCLIVDGTLNSFAPAGLTEYTIPDSVTTIGEQAFYDCNSLTSVYCKAITPPAVILYYYSKWYAFDYNASGRKIYVPMESVEAYKSASYWSDYASDIVGYNF